MDAGNGPGRGYWRLPAQGSMRALEVVVAHEVGELSLEIGRRPEGHLVEELAPDGADEPLDEWMRQGHVRHGLDLPDLQDPEIRPPTVE